MIPKLASGRANNLEQLTYISGYFVISDGPPDTLLHKSICYAAIYVSLIYGEVSRTLTDIAG